MDLKLAGKRALVTGSSSGIGEAIAKRLSCEGAMVVVHGRDEARARAVADAIDKDGAPPKIAVGDLATDAGAEKVRIAAFAAYGGIDILVNNAGARFAGAHPDGQRREGAPRCGREARLGR